MGNIYNISLGENFLKTVASFLNEEIESNEIKHYTAILPNNRSCRTFSKYLAQDKIKNKNELDGCFTWNIKKHNNKIDRLISVSDLLTYNTSKISSRISLVLRKRNPNVPVSTIFELAQSINELMKDLLLNNVAYSSLQDLVPDDLEEHWQHTLDTIKECMDDEEIQKDLTKTRDEVRNILNTKDNLMLIGLGNTNCFTKNLVESVAISQNGLIFVMGDSGSQNESYNKEILGRFGWKEIGKRYTNAYPEYTTQEEQIEFMEFPNIMDEAEGIGEIVAQSFGCFNSVLIVAPDVDLSKRIKSCLLQRNIIADDSFGDIFSKTPEGLLINLLLDAVLNKFTTRSCLKIFKMVDPKNAMDLELFLRKERMIFPKISEAIQVFRESATKNDSDTENENNKNDETNNDENVSRGTFWKMIQDFFDVIKSQEMTGDIEKSKYLEKTFVEWSEALKMILESLGCQEASAKLTEILAGYEGYSESFGKMRFGEYAIFLKKHCLKTALYHPEGYTEGITILGAIEAQILDADLIIIAGANEQKFTTAAAGQDDCWLSNSMKKILGIPTSESKDRFRMCIFERLASKKNKVIITRSEMVGGEKQVMYGFAKQLLKKRGAFRKYASKSFCGHCTNKTTIANAKEKDTPQMLASGNPPIEFRPNVFSVSDLERLKDNPYAFYAEKILNLKELDKIDETKNLRGNYVHKLLDNHVKKKYGNDIYKTAEMTRQEMKVDMKSLGFWYFRLFDVLNFVKENENSEVLRTISEKWGQRKIDIEIDRDRVRNDALNDHVQKRLRENHLQCTIKCRADRIDVLQNGMTSVIDYKTSSTKIPKKSVKNADRLQLLLEAWIARGNGFGSSYSKVQSIQYWFLSKECEKLVIEREDLEDFIPNAIEKVEKIIYKYNVLGDAYELNPEYKFDDGYIHLARLKELKNRRDY